MAVSYLYDQNPSMARGDIFIFNLSPDLSNQFGQHRQVNWHYTASVCLDFIFFLLQCF